jgi:hypothetical protein
MAQRACGEGLLQEEDVKFSDVDIRGQKFEIGVDVDGQFTTVLEGETIHAPTLAVLKDRLMKATNPKRRPISIPFYYWEEESWDSSAGKLKHGVIVGIHGSNDNLLIRWDKEKQTEQMSGYRHSGDNLMRLTETEAKHYLKLRANLQEVQKALESFTMSHTFDARQETKDAIAKAGG